MKFAIFTIIFIFLTGIIQIDSFNEKLLINENLYPNEIKGLEFFGKGKLKNLKLGWSKKKDVEIMFGESCEEECDYDENFRIEFEYVKALDDCMTTEDIRDKLMCPQNEFVGTIVSITLKPKKHQSLKDLPTSIFSIVSGGSITAKGSEVDSVSYTSFTDKYGLTYSINNELSRKVVVHSQYPSFVEGSLYSIKYIFTDDIIRKIFTVEYKTRKQEMNK